MKSKTTTSLYRTISMKTQPKQKITITIIETFILAHKDYILAVGYFGKINTQLQSNGNCFRN